MRLEELASKYNLFLSPLPTIKTSTPIPTITPFRTSASTLFLATTLPATSPNNPILVNTTVCLFVIVTMSENRLSMNQLPKIEPL
uniref:Uncharacterized protein n=1 Tax=Acrobeloides nanus TaxID=290746 RepID=A0A914DI14_9BILA